MNTNQEFRDKIVKEIEETLTNYVYAPDAFDLDLRISVIMDEIREALQGQEDRFLSQEFMKDEATREDIVPRLDPKAMRNLLRSQIRQYFKGSGE